jgi:hypothetical protein
MPRIWYSMEMDRRSSFKGSTGEFNLQKCPRGIIQNLLLRRKASSSDFTGASCITFTRRTASKSETFPPAVLPIDAKVLLRKLAPQTNSAAAWVPTVEIPAKISMERLGFSPGRSATMA